MGGSEFIGGLFYLALMILMVILNVLYGVTYVAAKAYPTVKAITYWLLEGDGSDLFLRLSYLLFALADTAADYGRVSRTLPTKHDTPMMDDIPFLSPTPITIGEKDVTLRFDGIKGVYEDIQVPIVINTADLVSKGILFPDCSNIEITTADGSPLPFWVQPETCNTSKTKIWVRLPKLEDGTTLHISFTDEPVHVNDGSKVFLFFDDFEGEMNKLWRVKTKDENSYVKVEDGKLIIYNSTEVFNDYVSVKLDEDFAKNHIKYPAIMLVRLRVPEYGDKQTKIGIGGITVAKDFDCSFPTSSWHWGVWDGKWICDGTRKSDIGDKRFHTVEVLVEKSGSRCLYTATEDGMIVAQRIAKTCGQDYFRPFIVTICWGENSPFTVEVDWIAVAKYVPEIWGIDVVD